MNVLKEKQENQKTPGFQGLSPTTQRLILEHVEGQFEGIPLEELPVEELRRLRDEVFRGKIFSDAIFPDPEEALRHIRGILSEEIALKTPNQQETARHMGHLIRGMDPSEVPANLSLLGKLLRKK